MKESIERSIKELDKEIRQVRKEAKLAPTLEEKLALQKKQKKLEVQRNKDRRELFDKQDEVDNPARRDDSGDRSAGSHAPRNGIHLKTKIQI